jgi:hypothetical protein
VRKRKEPLEKPKSRWRTILKDVLKIKQEGINWIELAEEHGNK